MDKAELNLFLQKTKDRVNDLRGSFDPEKLSSDLSAIENKLQDPEIWKDHKKLNEFNKQKTVLETKVNEFSVIEEKIADIIDLVSISIELNDSDELKNQVLHSPN